MGHVEAQGLKDRFRGERFGHIEFRRKEQALFLQFVQFPQDFAQLRLVVRIFQGDYGFLVVRPVEHAEDIVDGFVNQVDGAAVHVQDSHIAVYFHTVDQSVFHCCISTFPGKILCAGRRDRPVT